ncbi:MAG: hypothetical protein NTW81_04365 [Actinobacteria bacterium]|nr:hypothetical protein [Actinomycetota bacterium]
MTKIFSSIFPAKCIRCSRIENGLCEICRASLQIARGVDLPGIDQCWSAGPYSGWLRDAVLAYKSGRIEYRDGLVDVLNEVMQTAGYIPDCIVNIPSTIYKVRGRGFDTVGELSFALAKRTKTQVRPVLKFARKIQDQVGLDRLERVENLASAFTAEQVLYARVALIDDVVTTGATVIAAAKTLRLCGAKKIFTISLCRT